MGIWTSFFVSRPELASGFALDVDWDEEAVAHYTRMTDSNLTDLLAIVRGVPPESLWDVDCFELIHQPDEEGPWIYRFPSDLENHLARCTEIDCGELTAQWRAVDSEFDAFDPRVRLEICFSTGSTRSARRTTAAITFPLQRTLNQRVQASVPINSISPF
jgi:hypothetical protein